MTGASTRHSDPGRGAPHDQAPVSPKPRGGPCTTPDNTPASAGDRCITIVGGGMAGTLTGLALQARGVADVRILERRRRIDTTPCGEGVSRATLRRLGAWFDAEPHAECTFRGARWSFPGTTIHVHRPCHTMAREEWIPAMADAFSDRGGTVETGVAVRDAADLPGIVVGADGPGSVVRRSIPGADVQLRTGIQLRLETDATTDWLQFVTDKRFSQEYAWWFPRDGVHNVGLLAEEDGDDWKRLQTLQHHLGLEGRVHKREAYPIAFGGTRFQSVDGKRLLIGDAAGLTNPTTKGGIAAIVHAAPILADCIARGRPGDYQKRMQTHPLTDVHFQRALHHLRGWDNSTMERLLAAWPDAFHVGRGPTRAAVPVIRTLLRYPWAAKPAWDLYRAARLSHVYSW